MVTTAKLPDFRGRNPRGLLPPIQTTPFSPTSPTTLNHQQSVMIGEGNVGQSVTALGRLCPAVVPRLGKSGFSPLSLCSHSFNSVEQCLRKAQVPGSSPGGCFGRSTPVVAGSVASTPTPESTGVAPRVREVAPLTMYGGPKGPGRFDSAPGDSGHARWPHSTCCRRGKKRVQRIEKENPGPSTCRGTAPVPCEYGRAAVNRAAPGSNPGGPMSRVTAPVEAA